MNTVSFFIRMPRINVRLDEIDRDLAQQLVKMGKRFCPLIALSYIAWIESRAFCALLSPRLFPNAGSFSIYNPRYEYYDDIDNKKSPFIIAKVFTTAVMQWGEPDFGVYLYKITGRVDLEYMLYRKYGRMIGNKIY